MANSYVALSDLVTINDKNAADYGVSDLFDDAPLVKAMAATVASNGTNHKYLKETALAGSGFRAVNAGLDNSHSTDTLVTVALSILDASFVVDKSLADSYQKGPEAFIQREAKRKLKASMFNLEKQILLGTGNASGGFNGVNDTLSALGTYCISAGGTTATTGSSIYLIRTNDAGTDSQLVVGQDGSISVEQTVVQRVDDGTGKTYPGYYTPIEAYFGLQYGAVYSIVRIANVTADSGKGATDALIATAMALFPASRQPNLIAMGRRSLKQLQASRTATNATGAPAPFPTESFGVPIIVTDAIGSVEALVS